jgi:hypothetical protein
VKVVIKKRTISIATKKHFSILETRPKLKDESIILLKNMCATRQGLFAPIVQPIIKGIFANRTHKLLKDFTKRGDFKVSLEWTIDFMRNRLNWSYQIATIAIGKLPSTWEQEGTSMAHRVAYLVKMYNIPPCLVVNTNQTRVHLVPIGGDQTWARKGAKHIQVL